MCSSGKYPYPPPPQQKGLEIPGRVGWSQKPKNLKQCMKPHWNLQSGGGGGDYRANPFHGEMSIFSGTKQCKLHVVFMLISVLLLNDFV